VFSASKKYSSAILGVYQLKRVEEFIAKRNEAAEVYNEELAKLDLVQTVKCVPSGRCSYYKFPLILDSSLDELKFTTLLDKKYEIETGNVFYPPCHMQTVYEKLGGKCARNLSVAEEILARTITLPMHLAMEQREAKHVTDSIQSLLQHVMRVPSF